MRDTDVIPHRDPSEKKAYHESDEEWSGHSVHLKTGPNGQMEDHGQCRIRYVNPVWDSETQRWTYQNAVEGHPRQPGEGPMAYIQRISEIAEARLAGKPLPKMPHPQTAEETDARLQDLREQADEEWWQR